ncbi:MAG: insulinase family protein [Clostridia bacterium]|nr:insulinase family protein [Clostridia bacterium]
MPPLSYPLSHDMTLLHLPHDRYRTDRLTAVFAVPLRADTAAGYALLPGLLTHGCRCYPTVQTFNQQLDSLYGATLHAYVTHLGEWQMVIFSISYLNRRYTPDGSDLSAACAELLLDTLFDPLLEDGAFPADTFAQEQRCLIEEIQSELNNKRLYAIRRCTELLCPDHPFSLNPHGTVETVQQQTPHTAAQARLRLLCEAKVHWLYQSAADPAAITAAVESRFAALPYRRSVNLTTDTAFTLKESRRTDRMDVNQAKLVLGFRIAITEPSEQVAAAQLMNELLGGCPSSLLFTHVREEQSLCYYCMAGYDRHCGILLVDSGVQPENAAHTEQEIRKQLEAIRKGDFSDEELEAARRSLTQRFAATTDTPANLERYYVAQTPYDTYPTPAEMGQRLQAVTREQVCRAAQLTHFDAVYLLLPEEEVAHV